MTTYDVLIIGAGSVGVPLSFYLADKGIKVGVLEKNAYVGRGQNRAAIGGIRATHSDPAKIKICRESIEIIKNFEKEYGYDVGWIQGGYLFPVYEEIDEISLKELLKFQKKFDLNIDWIKPDDIQKIAPGITTDGLRGGTYSPGDGSANPLEVAGAFYMLAKSKGVVFHFNEEVISIDINGNRINDVFTNINAYSTDIIVNAAGADAREIGKLLGLNLPVFPESHEAGITEPVKRFFEPMIVDIRDDESSANYYFYQNADGQIVFCITPEPSIPGKDIDNTSEFLPLVTKRMLNLYPRLRNIRVRRTWRGLYPMTPDGFPIIGFANEVENFLLAIGMCGQGFMIGPGLGKILAEIITEGTDKYKEILQQLSLYRTFEGEEILK
jgi:sarcosine oxidase subunit beta